MPPSGKTGWPRKEESTGFANSAGTGQEWPRITVVTPSFNQGYFIEETIRSVLLQRYPNLEYIVIDGGSTDNTLNIIQEYRPWLSDAVIEPDKGQSDAINKGWRRSTGKILAWLNSDDVYEPNALFRVAAAWLANPSAGLWHGLCHEFDEGGIKRTIGEPYDMKIALSRGYDAGGRVAQPAAFLARLAIDRVGMLDDRLRQSMDKDVFQRVAAFYDAVFIPEVLARFRVHRDQLSQIHIRDLRFFIHRERLMALENLFALPNIPNSVMRLRGRAMARTHLRLAQQLRFGGKTTDAFRHLSLSLMSHAATINDLESFRALMLTLLGPKLSAWVSSIKRRCLRSPLQSAS